MFLKSRFLKSSFYSCDFCLWEWRCWKDEFLKKSFELNIHSHIKFWLFLKTTLLTLLLPPEMTTNLRSVAAAPWKQFLSIQVSFGYSDVFFSQKVPLCFAENLNEDNFCIQMLQWLEKNRNEKNYRFHNLLMRIQKFH